MALKGIKVIEMAGLAPAPFCGMILSDFGASVLKVDKIGSNVDLDCLSNGKQSLSLNLKHPKGVKILLSLANEYDVLIEPFRKGVMEKLGLGPEILCKNNPRLIYARLSGYGQLGLYSSKAGHDINYVSLSGILSLLGRHRENPIFPINLLADFGGGGLMCSLGIIMALYERKSSNMGQIVDNSMVSGTSYLSSWIYRSQNLPIWGKARGKNILDSGAHFYEVYKTKDNKYMSVGALEPQFYTELLKGLNLDYDYCPQFDNFEENKAIFKEKFAEKTQAEWCKIFENLDACITPVLELNEAPKHEHNLQSDTFIECENNFIPKPAPNLSRTPGQSSSMKPPPKRGEHTKMILQQLKYSDEHIDELENEGAIECYKNSKL